MSAPHARWYELFARGERDWLRHNRKVREAVRAYVPQLLASPDLMSGHPDRPVRVPLHLLEHARFRLASLSDGERGAGQGTGRPGDMLRPGRDPGGPDGGSPAGAAGPAPLGGSSGTDGAPGTDAGDGALSGAGGHAGPGYSLRVQLEFAASDIMDWLWEELELPLLVPGPGQGTDPADARNGWSKQGAPSQLDRRRTVMQAVKRRAAYRPPGLAGRGAGAEARPGQAPCAGPAALPAPDNGPPPFVNDDLRFRQALPKPHAAGKAVVLFAMDVSASMTLAERKLAKTFFHFTLHGLRRRYRDVAVRFLAHTTRAWEFPERDFFQIAGEGGTQASSVFALAHAIARGDYGGGRYNTYLFYASDGENSSEDRVAASLALAALSPMLNYMGYVETAAGPTRQDNTASELHRLFAARKQAGDPVASCVLREPDDAWTAIRCFFRHGEAAA